MPFLLQRGGKNVPLEVQRWQYFLLKSKIPQAGLIDAQFGAKTAAATKIFQIQHALKPTGRLDAVTLQAAEEFGYAVQPDNYYDDKMDDTYPPRPKKISSPSNNDRNTALGCFTFKQLPLANRGDPDEIVPLGSCDGKVPDWRKTNIVDIDIPQLKFAQGYPGVVRCHLLVAPHIADLFAEWEKLDLLHLIRTYDGAYNPRYKRGKSPSSRGHGTKRSDQTSALSNHAFGSAFHLRRTAIAGQFFHCFARAFGLRQSCDKLVDDMAEPMGLLLASDVACNPARVLHVLVPVKHFRHRCRLRSGRIPQMHGKDQRILARVVVKHRLGRRVRQNTAVPIQFAIDACGREPGEVPPERSWSPAKRAVRPTPHNWLRGGATTDTDIR